MYKLGSFLFLFFTLNAWGNWKESQFRAGDTREGLCQVLTDSCSGRDLLIYENKNAQLFVFFYKNIDNKKEAPKIKKDRLDLSLEFTILFKASPQSKVEVIIDEGSFLPLPLSLEFLGENVLMTRHWNSRKQIKSPLISRRILCDKNNCELKANECALNTKSIQSSSILKEFQSLSKKIAPEKRGLQMLSKHSKLMDDLFFLAGSGNQEAKKVFHELSEASSLNAEVSEELGTYELYIEELSKAGCSSLSK